jgi:hypothetical protein
VYTPKRVKKVKVAKTPPAGNPALSQFPSIDSDTSPLSDYNSDPEPPSDDTSGAIKTDKALDVVSGTDIVAECCQILRAALPNGLWFTTQALTHQDNVKIQRWHTGQIDLLSGKILIGHTREAVPLRIWGALQKKNHGRTALVLFHDFGQERVAWPMSPTEHIEFETIFQLMWREPGSGNSRRWKARILKCIDVALVEAGIQATCGVAASKDTRSTTIARLIEENLQERKSAPDSPHVPGMQQTRQHFTRTLLKAEPTLQTDEHGHANVRVVKMEEGKGIKTAKGRASKNQTDFRSSATPSRAGEEREHSRVTRSYSSLNGLGKRNERSASTGNTPPRLEKRHKTARIETSPLLDEPEQRALVDTTPTTAPTSIALTHTSSPHPTPAFEKASNISLKVKIKTLEATNAELLAKVAQQDSALEASLQESSTTAEKLTDLETTHATLAEKLSLASHTIALLKEQNADLSQSNTELLLQNDDLLMRPEHTHGIDNLTCTNANLEEKMDYVEALNGELMARNRALEREREGLECQVALMRERVGEMAGLRARLRELEMQVRRGVR